MTGNPAAVCPLEAWLPAATMQAIACEMNLSETAFFAPVPNSGAFGIRWFTPSREVDLIGHATLAAGHLVLERLRPDARSVRFLSDSTELIVARKEGALALEMPALPPQPVRPPPALARGLGRQPKAVLAAKHYLCVFDAAGASRHLDLVPAKCLNVRYGTAFRRKCIKMYLDRRGSQAELPVKSSLGPRLMAMLIESGREVRCAFSSFVHAQLRG